DGQASREPHRRQNDAQRNPQGQDEGGQAAPLDDPIEFHQQRMHYEGNQDGPCNRSQERGEQDEQLISHERQETEEENLDDSLAVEHRRGPGTAGGSLAKASKVVSCAAPPSQAAAGRRYPA